MSVSRLRELLAGERRFTSPFLMLGDPTPDASVQLACALVQAGAGMLELGLPYADPSADGPAVQAAGERARAAGVSTDQALEVLARIRAACPETPCNLLVYGNLVHARGYQRFCKDAVAAGASSLLVPDVPLEEGEPLRHACREQELGVVLLCGPRTPEARLDTIAQASDAFVYLAGHQGITGAKAADRDARRALCERVVARLSVPRKVPLCVGFGLRTREDVADVHASGAHLAVVGSHLLRALEAAWQAQPGDADACCQAVVSTFQSLLPATPRREESSSCS
ncbi:MAG: tryptophan synthase subunit alpha [Planctomycetota bacterium]